MPPLKGPELHAALRRDLRDAFGALGFKRTPKANVASWCRQEDASWLVVWFQPSQSNGPEQPGFKFTMEFLLGPDPIVYGMGYRKRLPTLLDDRGREDLRRLTNEAISKLPPPNQAFGALLDPQTRAHWLKGWEPISAPILPNEDAWMRQGDEDDVRALTALIVRELPSALNRFRAGIPAARHVPT